MMQEDLRMHYSIAAYPGNSRSLPRDLPDDRELRQRPTLHHAGSPGREA